MEKKKTYVLTLSAMFPKKHSKAGIQQGSEAPESKDKRVGGRE